MSIETPWANDAAGGTKVNATRLLAYTPLRGSFTNPNGNVVGSPGNTYLNTTGGAGTTLWVKESGTGTNTGWVATGTGGGGSGTVTSVTATDATITVAGSASAPTVGVGVIPESKITNLTADLAAKADLVSGKVPTAQLATGTASNTTFHRGDGTWSTPAGSGGGTVTSVTAGDGTVTVAGSASAPTVAVNVIPESKVTNLTVDLAAKADLVSGKVPTTQLATGTANSTTFHRGDGTWSTPAGGSSQGIFSVRAATTQTDSSTSGPQTVDGVACVAGDRVLYQTSSTATFNGIYVVTASGSWGRAADMASGSIIPNGSLVSVHEGSIYGNKTFQLNNATAGSTGATIGTNPLALTVLPSITPWVTPSLDTTNVNQYIANIPRGGGHYLVTLDRNYTFGVIDGIGNEFFETHLCIVENSTGGWSSTFPGSFHWHGIPTDGAGQPMFATAPNTITFVRLTWMGTGQGYLAET